MTNMSNLTELIQKHEDLKLRDGVTLLEDIDTGNLYIKNRETRQILEVVFKNGQLQVQEFVTQPDRKLNLERVRNASMLRGD